MSVKTSRYGHDEIRSMSLQLNERMASVWFHLSCDASEVAFDLDANAPRVANSGIMYRINNRMSFTIDEAEKVLAELQQAVSAVRVVAARRANVRACIRSNLMSYPSGRSRKEIVVAVRASVPDDVNVYDDIEKELRGMCNDGIVQVRTNTNHADTYQLLEALDEEPCDFGHDGHLIRRNEA